MELARLRSLAQELGFAALGVAPALPYPGAESFRRWLEAGYHAQMDWLARDPERRSDPRRVLEGAACVVMLWTPYDGGTEPERRDDAPRGRVARYAWGEDYHDRILDRTRALGCALGDPAARAYVDTGPVLERSAAERAGLGWIGRNGCLIRQGEGSYGFLSALLTEVPLPVADASAPVRCGTCTRCMEACPTGAIVSPGVVDSRRCLSYLTIEHKGLIPLELRAPLGDWIFGCDVCQEVCPWNDRARPKPADPCFQPRERERPVLTEILLQTPGQFAERFRGRALKRAKRHGLARNAAIALGNARDPATLPHLGEALRTDPHPWVRASAAWALGQLALPAARRALDAARALEPDPMVGAEIAGGLEASSPG